MTEYEYGSLFVAFLEASNVVVANYITITFAMLTASYFLAAKLTRAMCTIFLVLYTIWSLSMISGVYGSFSDFCRLGLAINELGLKPTASLGWIGPIAAGEQVGYMRVLPQVMLATTVFSYLASIAFFFVVRIQRHALADVAQARELE